jgi:DNA-binding NarL/FixJ family response regulator
LNLWTAGNVKARTAPLQFALTMKPPNSRSSPAGPGGKRRVFIIDDQPIIRERVIELIDREADLTVCGEADDIQAAMELIAREQPHLVITGLSFKNSHGLSLVKDLRARFPGVRVLVFSTYDELLYGERTIRSGAHGFIEKRAATKELLAAMRQVLNGEIYLSEKVAATTVGRFFRRPSPKQDSPLAQLSDRELEVFQLIGRGRSTKQIAAVLRISVKTIETYRGRIKVKLKLANATELVAQAKRSLQDVYSPPA